MTYVVQQGADAEPHLAVIDAHHNPASLVSRVDGGLASEIKLNEREIGCFLAPAFTVNVPAGEYHLQIKLYRVGDAGPTFYRSATTSPICVTDKVIDIPDRK